MLHTSLPEVDVEKGYSKKEKKIIAVDLNRSPIKCLLKFVSDCVPCVIVLRCLQTGKRATRAEAGNSQVASDPLRPPPDRVGLYGLSWNPARSRPLELTPKRGS